MSNLIEQEFESLRAAAFPTAKGVELSERRMMFYAGYQSCLRLAENASDDQITMIVVAVDQELKRFADSASA